MRSAISLFKNRPGSSTIVVHRRCRLAENTEPIDRVGINCLRGYHNQNPSGRTIIVQKGVSYSAPWTRSFYRLGASRAFLMVSGTLNRETDEIEKIRKALGSRCVGTFDAMPPHTPRGRDCRRRAGPRGQRRSHRHGRRRLDHRRRQGGAALPRQRRRTVEGIDTDPGPWRRRAADDRANGAPDQRADHDRRRRVQRHCRRHQRAHQGQGRCCAIRW
jgi:hypothetical protein